MSPSARSAAATEAAQDRTPRGRPEIDSGTGPEPLLRVQTLGRFRVWRDGRELPGSVWERDKAVQLLQFLLTRRGRLTERERIVEALWPEQSIEAGERDFKVALSSLLRAIEPERAPRAESQVVSRAGTAYGLAPGAAWVDAQALEAAVAAGNRDLAGDPESALRHYRAAAELYQGDFLPERRYEDWACAEQERLQMLALGAMANLAALVLEANPLEALHLAARIHDVDPLWEEAWRLEMRAHLARGNPGLALRAWQRCVQALDAELGIAPLPATRALVEPLLSAGARLETSP
ncbi:MAG: winged helix-turn-helix domain-containing protein [Caldilineae bacterium]|nr:winged helix-turn-helix domain-containing protein [Caldilineae bacterium]